MDAKNAALPKNPPEQPPLHGRDRLARLVVVGSFLTLFLLVIALIGLSQSTSTQVSDAAKNAFTAVLPVLAGWVGTVLAFYFSAAWLDRTSESFDKAISQPSGGAFANALVSEKMIGFGSIAKLQTLGDGAKPPSISDLKKLFDTELKPGSKLTRLIFVENSVFKYVLHIGTLNAFIVKHQDAETKPQTFSDILDDEEALRQISKLVVFVSARSTMADAKAALDKVTGAQDIIVTGSGNATEPMLGWLSNVDLTRALEVSKR